MITIAQIGCGYWGPNLLRNLIANPNCKVKYACDLSIARHTYLNQHYPGVIAMNDCNIIFQDPEVQAIVIATPAATHYDIAVKALKNKKHVLIEKPFATSVAEVKHIRELAKQEGLIAMAGHTFLYNNAILYLKQIIENKKLGSLRYIYSQRLNLGRIRNDVDALWNFAPHDISIIQYLLDDACAIKVSRSGMDYLQKGIEDVTFLNIVYPGKIMANVHVSWLDPHKVRRMVIVGSKRMAVYDDMAEHKIAIYDKNIDPMAILGENMEFDMPGAIQFNHRFGDIVMPKIDFVEPLKQEIDHFLDCINNDVVCRSGADHALGVISILEQACHS